MIYLEFLKHLIDRYALLALYSERIDDALTELYAAYAAALALKEDAVREEVA